MEQGYWLNVARRVTVQNTHTHEHHCRVYCGDGEEAISVANDVAERFPAPRFRCELTRWQHIGTTIELGV